MIVECMLDLETWGMAPDGLIISIGATKFVRTPQPKIVDRLHVCIDPETATGMPFSTTLSTLRWWMDEKQNKAREAWLAMEKVDIGTALTAFDIWYQSAQATPDQTTPEQVLADLPPEMLMPSLIWGNGVDFDVVLLEHAYKAFNQKAPWNFRDRRCHRTLKNLVPKMVQESGWELGTQLASPGVDHSALYDAEVQTWQNIECMAYLRTSE